MTNSFIYIYLFTFHWPKLKLINKNYLLPLVSVLCNFITALSQLFSVLSQNKHFPQYEPKFGRLFLFFDLSDVYQTTNFYRSSQLMQQMLRTWTYFVIQFVTPNTGVINKVCFWDEIKKRFKISFRLHFPLILSSVEKFQYCNSEIDLFLIKQVLYLQNKNWLKVHKRYHVVPLWQKRLLLFSRKGSWVSFYNLYLLKIKTTLLMRLYSYFWLTLYIVKQGLYMFHTFVLIQKYSKLYMKITTI